MLVPNAYPGPLKVLKDANDSGLALQLSTIMNQPGPALTRGSIAHPSPA